MFGPHTAFQLRLVEIDLIHKGIKTSAYRMSCGRQVRVEIDLIHKGIKTGTVVHDIERQVGMV